MNYPLIAALTVALLGTAFADPPSNIDTESFERQTAEALKLRAKRTLDSDAFIALMAQDDVVLLDTRSKWAYDRRHLKGAVHLNFSDFTVEKLAKVIPTKATTVLIYCNNNIGGDAVNFAAKESPMALNIPTFINLFGYGYEEVYELGTLVDVSDSRFTFAGTDPVRRARPPSLR